MALLLAKTSGVFPLIAGYTLTEQLYEGSRTAVYRAVSSTQQPVVIKVLRQSHPSFHELVHFRHQYTVTKDLPIPNIVRPLSLDPFGNGYALMMEDFGGLSLQAYTQAHSLTIIETLGIAAQLADVLHQLCQHRVIHKDIKPANILIHPASKQVKLIDFSIASLLPKEIQENQNPTSLEGTLAYLAPEQTGRMNRGIDYRTDFYSLGVTLYELLTGQLPFSVIAPLELIHCHLAKAPTPPHQLNPEISAVLSQLVLKLMAKNAEDRYQSALGLKHDVEQCLVQWKETGTIANFELGRRDTSDRFLIPEKLYGREAEVQTLLNAFERASQGRAEMLLIAGFSGIGKTAVVNEIHKPITRQHGYFIKGKFDQFNRNIPFSGFVQVFRRLIEQLLGETEAQLAQWKSEILSALTGQSQVIIDVIPELEDIIGKQPEVPPLAGNLAQKRFNQLFSRFVRLFATKEHPLVIFLDDLQWSDSASLDLLQALTSGADVGYLLVVGAYRDNEVSPTHPLMVTLEAIQAQKTTINTVTLQPLAEEDITHLVADTLLCSAEIVAPFSDEVYQKTKGNPFFTTQFLQELHEKSAVIFNPVTDNWKYDLAKVKALALTDDVVAFMVQRLQQFSTATQSALKIAACIGTQFDLNTLSLLCEQPPQQVASDLWAAIQSGFLIPENAAYNFSQDRPLDSVKIGALEPRYRFLHDRIHQAAYSLIPETARNATHLKIGRLLLKNIALAEREPHIFILVHHLNHGLALIDTPAETAEIIQLNVVAGCKAKQATAYSAAIIYLMAAHSLLSDNHWQNQYETSLLLYGELAEAAYLIGDLTQAETWLAGILEQSKNFLDAVKAHEIKIYADISRNQLQPAVETALSVLQQLDIEFSSEPAPAEYEENFFNVRRLWGDKSAKDLLNLPLMSSAKTQTIVRILAAVTPPVYFVKPSLYPLVVLKIVELSLAQGNAPESYYGYACYGLLLCGVVGDYSFGYQVGQVALELLEASDDREHAVKTHFKWNAFIAHWKSPLGQTLLPLKQNYQRGLDQGDLVFAGASIAYYALQTFLAGRPLTDCIPDLMRYRTGVCELHQPFAQLKYELALQTALNFSVPSEAPATLIGEVHNEATELPLQIASGNQTYLFDLAFFKLILAYSFGSYQLAYEQVLIAEENIGAAAASPQILVFYFYRTLIQLSCYPNLTSEEQLKIRPSIDEGAQKLQHWATLSPDNCQHKLDLLLAEKCRVLDQSLEAIKHYDYAILGARNHGYSHEEALANELAARFYLELGKPEFSVGYMEAAYYSYARWGSQAKTDDLEQRYPELISSILQSSSSSSSLLPNSLETISTIVSPSASVHGFTISTSTTTNDFNTALDLAVVLKASQTLSSTIQLDELLRQLTTIILQQSGGEHCVLLMPSDGGTGPWQVQVTATVDAVDLAPTALEGNLNLPIRLIQYVKNTQNAVIVDDLKTDLPIIDDYLSQHQPKSLLCLPLLNQGKVIGVLYVTNQLSSGVFTENRLLILNFLCPQAAISLENARLYQQAQAYVNQIEQSQLQTVQSEKMAALGNLVAGVAHEINNPIGFLNGSIHNAQNYVQDLQSQLDLYQQYHPEAAVPVQENAEDIDLDFVCEDLPKLLTSMQGATDRIKAISKSLRVFSRADAEHKVSAQLQEGLDSTLLILKYRLKANEYRPAIEIVTDYGETPSIECFPGRLNQVFMNILANAIDVFDEAAEQSSFAELKDQPQIISIKTAVLTDLEAIEIRISDNGKGMPEAVSARIFDHLFTTKGVGKGTGLGLAIAQQIVVEAHGGNLAVQSEPGQGTEFCLQLPF